MTINEVHAARGLTLIVNGDNVYGSFAVVPIESRELLGEDDNRNAGFRRRMFARIKTL